MAYGLHRSRRMYRWRSVYVLASAAVQLGILVGTAGAAEVVRTSVTTYSYNADGAPSAITTQIDDGEPSTVYLTWDNFEPDSGDPSTGSVSVANGNLASSGGSPGAGTSYRFDRRDRLVGYSANGVDVTYTYHADGTMSASTVAGGVSLSFYYDRGQYPQVTNMYQDSSGVWTGRLGQIRHLSDGEDQILMSPRKDVAGTYDPSSQTYDAYRYDAFGACACAGTCTCAANQATYDIHDNPFGYAGEYRDAVSGAHYLRARWYDATLPTFLSRDPMAHLNRYGYGDGNPVMMVDPGGMSAGFWGDLGHGFAKAVDWLNSGTQGHFARLFLSPVLYPLEIVAHPESFWKGLEHDPVQIAFVGVSAVVAATGVFSGASAVALEVRQTLVGTVQSGFSGFGDFRSKHVHFDATAFVDGLESSLGASLAQAGLGFGRTNPYSRSLDNVEALRSTLKENDTLIVRFRDKTSWPATWTSPLLERANLGLYHEGLVAITKSDTFVTEVLNDGKNGFVNTQMETGMGLADVLAQARGRGFKASNFTFSVVGKVDDIQPIEFYANPHNLQIQGYGKYAHPNYPVETHDGSYNLLFRNCHHHVTSVLKQLKFRY